MPTEPVRQTGATLRDAALVRRRFEAFGARVGRVRTCHQPKENEMYIGGGVITLIIIILLLVWIF